MNYAKGNEVAESCRSFCRELATISGLSIYFLPEALKEIEKQLPYEPTLGCPLLGNSGLRCEECRHFLRSFLAKLQSDTDGAAVAEICPAGLQIAALRLPSSSSCDVLVAGQVLPSLPSADAVQRLRRKLGAEVDFEYLCYRYASIPCVRESQFKHLILLLQTFAHLLSQLPSQQLTHKGRDHMSECVKRALEEIHLRYCHGATPRQVAEKAGVTYRHLTRTFKRETGHTIGKYLTRLRVARMADLLHNSRSSVGEATFASGFQSISAGYRAFHEITGETPSAYRKHPAGPEIGEKNVFRGV